MFAMKQSYVWAFLLGLLGAACGGCGDSSTAPAAKAADHISYSMYGVWSGTFKIGDTSEEAMVLKIGKGSVAIWLSGDEYPATLEKMTSSSVRFSLYLGDTVTCDGFRFGTKMTGLTTSRGIPSGRWSVVKISAALAGQPRLTGTGLAKKPRDLGHHQGVVQK
jgi:hypothetical protein